MWPWAKGIVVMEAALAYKPILHTLNLKPQFRVYRSKVESYASKPEW